MVDGARIAVTDCGAFNLLCLVTVATIFTLTMLGAAVYSSRRSFPAVAANRFRSAAPSFQFIGPGLAVRVADVHDPGFGALDAPIDEEWVAAGLENAYCVFFRQPTALWKIADEPDGSPQCQLDIPGAGRIFPVRMRWSF